MRALSLCRRFQHVLNFCCCCVSAVQVACASAYYSTLPILAFISVVPAEAKFWQGLRKIHQGIRKVLNFR
jgi:hypothetical protein